MSPIETVVLIGILMLLTIANLKLAIDYLDSKESQSKKEKKMLDFLIPDNPGMIIVTAMVFFLLWLTHKDDEKDSILRAKRHQEEKETLGTAVEITLTHRQVQRHLETILLLP